MPRPDLQRALPPQNVGHLNVPNLGYQYFADAAAHPFDFQTAEFRLLTAWYLAEASFLAYLDEATARQKIEAQGNPAGLTEFTFLNGGGTQAFVANNANFAIVSFRGTEVPQFDASNWISSLRDILQDVRFFPAPWEQGGHVHSGFKAALENVWESLSQHLQQRRATHPGLRIWFTGHSMGAVLAVLAATRYNQAGEQVMGVYTYGCPFVGDEEFVRRYPLATRTFHFVNNNDGVAGLPKVYQNVGQLKYITSQGEILDHIGRPAPFADSVRGIAATLLAGGGVPDNLADHAPINYATHIWNAYVNQL